jgi:hypothetical protein
MYRIQLSSFFFSCAIHKIELSGLLFQASALPLESYPLTHFLYFMPEVKCLTYFAQAGF